MKFDASQMALSKVVAPSLNTCRFAVARDLSQPSCSAAPRRRAAAAQPGADGEGNDDATPSANDDGDLEVEAFEAKAAKRGVGPRAGGQYTQADFDRFEAWVASCLAFLALSGEGYVPDSLHPVFECLKDHDGVRPATVEELKEKVMYPKVKSREMLCMAVFTDVPFPLRLSASPVMPLCKALAALGVPYFPSAGDGGYVLDLADSHDMEGGLKLLRSLGWKGPLDSKKLQKRRADALTASGRADGSLYRTNIVSIGESNHTKSVARKVDGKRAGRDLIEGTESQTYAATLQALKDMYHTFNEVRAGRSADLTAKELRQLAAAYSNPPTGTVFCRACGCDVTLRGVGYRVHEHYMRYDEEAKLWRYYMLDAPCCTPCNLGVIAAVRSFGFHELPFLASKARTRGMLEDVCESRAGNYFVA
ncbi:methyltransferase [Aureococcus anophagefferens]|nr:methyltransferase [Aureococcus anophagefferens]